ncbi:UNVERIFIED_CONTAM: Retrovirus-related Pol polyprotein from transposon TNT 1-94 [Sesamum calycinum]|uniref:Retrovirus-related Pol polyprotein from transposon TNT 1-94 n=1 Tax=Sesamum calycinum TaxID=2727403 RepID=A0AAW2L6T9_9LAMI
MIMSKNPLTVILDNNKFNRTNYTDWLSNLGIVLDYENKGYIMDKPLPQTLLDGSSSEESETFERWYADHRKVRSIILAFMSNYVQKQYYRLDDVASILQCMKEVYAIPDRHTSYIATKEFFRAKMTEGSSVQEHGVKMLSLVEKLEDLKAGLENNTYIGEILQSFPLSYDPFIVNFNMNGLEKSINDLIDMLVQYKATINKSAPSVLIREASTSKWEWARERGGWVLSSSQEQTISAPIAVRKGIRRGIVPIYLPVKVLQRSRKLTKDEAVLRLGDSKAVTAKAVGIINLVISDRVMLELKDCYFVPSMIKNIISIPLLDNVGFEFLINKNYFYLMKDGSSHLLDNLENAQIWHARLGHISQDRMKRRLWTTEYSGQRGFSYFITFTDDHSWYDYVYLMSYKPEIFVRFKEFRLEVENQTGRKIKTLRSDRGGEYLSGELIDYLKENGIVSVDTSRDAAAEWGG